MKANAVHAIHPEHWVVVTAPNDDRSVGVTLDFDLDGHKSSGTMMLGPIELHSP